MASFLFENSFFDGTWRSNPVVVRFSLAAFYLLAFGACCPATEERIPAHTNFSDLYILVPSGEDTATAAPDDVIVDVEPDDHRFRISIENGSSGVIELVEESARYIDENGELRPLRFDLHSAHGTTEFQISSGSRLSIDAAPSNKVKTVREHCFSETTWVEPLVPYSTAGLTRDKTLERVDQLHRRRAPIGLVLVFETDKGSRSEMRRSFILKPRWATPDAR